MDVGLVEARLAARIPPPDRGGLRGQPRHRNSSPVRRLEVRYLAISDPRGGSASRVDLLAAPGRESEVASAVARCLATVAPRPSALIFEGVRDDSPWPRLLAEAWPSVRAPRLYREYSMPAPYLELEAQSFDAWFGSQTAHFRSRMRRGLRKLESGGGELRLVSPPGDKARYVSEFARLHYSQWEPHGGSGVLTEGVRKMLLEAALQSDGEGPVELWAIDLPTGTVSVQIVVRTGGEASHWLGGIDSALAAMRPGPAILTLTRLIEHAFSSGIGRLDLGAGDQPFKREFAEKAETLEWLTLCVSRWQCLAARTMHVSARTRHMITRRLSLGAKTRLRRLRTGLLRLIPQRPGRSQ